MDGETADLQARLDALTARLDEQAARIADLATENARLRERGRPVGGAESPPRPAQATSRRGLLAGAAALVGAGLARLGGAERAEATHGPADGTTAIHATVTNFTAQYTRVHSSDTVNPAFIGVSGSGLDISPHPDGLQGITNSTGLNAAGVRGYAGQNGAGVRAQGGSGNPGLPGGLGLWASAIYRVGIFGTSENRTGIFGVSKSTDPDSTPEPPTIAGVAGQGFGRAGVYGLSDSAVGVSGQSTSNVGVRGESASSIGVLGASASVYGVNGVSTSGAGVFGLSNTGFGVYGYSYGTGGAAVGLYGVANSGEGLVGLTQTGIGVHGNAVQSGLAGRFDGRVVVNGTLTVTGGFTTSAIASADGDYRRTYSQESPEPWLEDFGTAILQNGRAEVALDPELDAVVESAEYLVFLTPRGIECGPLYVSRQGEHGFEVRSYAGPLASGTFDYRVVARRRDVTGNRLERIPAANVNLGKDSPPPPAPRTLPDARTAPNAPTLRPDQLERPRP